MSTWTANTTVASEPETVLAMLTDPAAIAGWAPIPFEVDALDGERLTAGTRARVSGKLAGFGASFEIDVLDAHASRFALVARGPVVIDVEYELFDDAATAVWVTVGVRSGGGIAGRLLAQATEALLRAGALDHALQRIANQIEEAHDDVCARVA